MDVSDQVIGSSSYQDEHKFGQSTGGSRKIYKETEVAKFYRFWKHTPCLATESFWGTTRWEIFAFKKEKTTSISEGANSARSQSTSQKNQSLRT